MWLVWALLSAVCAALTSVVAKIGIEGIDSNLATAVRTGIVLVLSWLIVFASRAHTALPAVSIKNWCFLTLSGLLTGASWLCYYRALKMGDISRVAGIDKLSMVFTLVFAFIILREEITLKTALAALLITAGAVLMAL